MPPQNAPCAFNCIRASSVSEILKNKAVIDARVDKSASIELVSPELVCVYFASGRNVFPRERVQSFSIRLRNDRRFEPTHSRFRATLRRTDNDKLSRVATPLSGNLTPAVPAAQITFIYFDAPGKRRKRKPGKRNQEAENPKDSCRRIPVHARRARAPARLLPRKTAKTELFALRRLPGNVELVVVSFFFFIARFSMQEPCY